MQSAYALAGSFKPMSGALTRHGGEYMPLRQSKSPVGAMSFSDYN